MNWSELAGKLGISRSRLAVHRQRPGSPRLAKLAPWKRYLSERRRLDPNFTTPRMFNGRWVWLSESEFYGP